MNSVSGGAFYAINSKNENHQLKISGTAYYDKWKLIYPLELRKYGGPELLSVDVKHLYDLSLTLTSVLNKRMRASLIVEGVYQNGLLSTPFHRVYFTDSTDYIEILPKQKFKIPVGLQWAVYLSDFAIARAYYRYYWDSFGIQAHTAELELPLKLGGAFRLTPFYRFHYHGL